MITFTSTIIMTMITIIILGRVSIGGRGHADAENGNGRHIILIDLIFVNVNAFPMNMIIFT